MTPALTSLLAIVLAMALAFVLVIGVELFSAAVYPVPAELQDNIPEHVRRYPTWILAVVVPLWGATAGAAAWVASRMGGRIAGAIVALLLALALGFNLAMLPYVPWFKVVMPVAFAVACLLGAKSGARHRLPPAQPAAPAGGRQERRA